MLGALLVVGGVLIGIRSRRQGASGSGAPVAPAPGREPRIGMRGWLSELQRKLPPDVILLSRDASTGEWLVELEGQRYRRLADIHDDRAATKILSAIEGLRVFAGIAAAPPSQPAQPTPTHPSASPSTSLRAGLPTPSGRGLRRAGPEPAPPAGPVLTASQPATYPAPEGSIIAQIEAILQRELERRPDLNGRTIHMGTTPDGSLLIEVDRDFYRSPDTIPDPRVRDVVMSAVRAWEKS